MNIYKKFFILIFTGFLFSQPASAIAENVLDISVIKYEPTPVEPGQSFDIWIRAKNIGDSDIPNVYVEISPEFPFLLQPGETGVRYVPLIMKGDSITYRFSLKADNNAIKGNNKITIGYRINNVFTTRQFDIQIGFLVTDVKGVIEVEKYQISPEVLMPGDVGVVTLTLRNPASQPSIKFEGKDYSTNAQIQSITMLDIPPIKVLSDPYSNVGIIGPGSRLDARFIIKIDNSVKNGIYFMDIDILGSSNLREKIPLKVDDSGVEIIPVDTSGSSITLNIANLRPNTIEAVSIIPDANRTIFRPAKYFIGTMQPNEVFTIKFDINSIENENLKFKARFKNDANWHESEIKIAQGRKIPQSIQGNPGGNAFPGGNVLTITVITIILLLGFYTYMKQKRRKTG